MSSVAVSSSGSKVPGVVLWGAQVALALAFGMAGVMKSTAPLAELGAQMPWAADSPGWLVRFVGVSEVLGAVGLLLPAALRVLPFLTPVAAASLTVVMALAAAMHAARGEVEALPVNAVLGALALFVAVGRTAWRPVRAR